jgi:phage terminase large subunit
LTRRAKHWQNGIIEKFGQPARSHPARVFLFDPDEPMPDGPGGQMLSGGAALDVPRRHAAAEGQPRGKRADPRRADPKRADPLSTLKIPTAKIFEPLLQPARYKGVYGGRGSGKSHFFGELLVETCQAARGTLAVCIREAQRTLAQSSKRLIEGKIAGLGLGHGFRIFSDKIETPGDGLIIFRGLQDHNAESIKSLEGFRIAWIDEAQSLSARSLALLRPTIRARESELWASWNPRRKSDAIDDFLRGRRPEGARVVKANWRDNPWFPGVLEEERLLDQKLYPERYDHIWEGDYARAFEGAYFAALLSDARAQGRIGKVAADPLLPLRAFIDIGGARAAADAFTIWIVQWVGSEIRADFQHLRRWRKSVEQAQSYTFKAVITVIVSGLVGAVWLGVKVMLGK